MVMSARYKKNTAMPGHLLLFLAMQLLGTGMPGICIVALILLQ